MLKLSFGTFCTNYNSTVSTNHTFRLENLNFDKIFETFLKNLNDFFKLLELCKKLDISIFRLGSNFIPFASHKSFKEEWLLKIEPYIVEACKIIKEKYQIRITMHPGQFVVLNSLNKKVLENSLRELKYHFWLLDKLGIGKEGIVIIHIGGKYEDKKRSIERFICTVEKNNWFKRRLCIENDEKNFSAKDIVYISNLLNIPMVFDYFHNLLNPSEFDINDIVSTWKNHSTPKFHLSSQGKGRIGMHGDFVKFEDFINFYRLLKTIEIDKIDIMIESKKKEKAVLKLRKDIMKNMALL